MMKAILAVCVSLMLLASCGKVEVKTTAKGADKAAKCDKCTADKKCDKCATKCTEACKKGGKCTGTCKKAGEMKECCKAAKAAGKPCEKCTKPEGETKTPAPKTP